MNRKYMGAKTLNNYEHSIQTVQTLQPVNTSLNNLVE